MNLKRAAFLALLTAVPLLLGVQSGDPATLQFRLTQQSEPHVETVTGWMVRNTLAKLAGGNQRPATPDEVRQHFAELDQLLTAGASSGPARTASPDFDLQSIRSHLRSAEPMVEKSIEESVTRVALASGLGERLGGLELFGPPVYFRFSTLPKLLVVSPRDRIERKATVLLEPDISIRDSEALEQEVSGTSFSALVTSIGGLGVYPSMVPESADPRWTFRTVGHEWVHQFLAFRPLGWRYALGGEDDSRVISINETVAEVVGRELGDQVYAYYYTDLPLTPPPTRARDTEFSAAMRQIRLRVDEMLARGEIDEAEAFMERSRQDLEEKGFHIRKLNQAYFAFYGSYAEVPSAGGRLAQEISNRVRSLRASSADLGDYLWKVSGVATYEDFLRLTAAP